MLAGALREGDEIIIPRAVHMAAVHAVAILSLNPRFVMPVDGRPFEDGQPDTASFLAAMRDHPEAKAVYVTCPDYYGRTIDLRVIATEARRLGMILLVDEAHGAHFAAAPGLLPPTALSQGADIVAQSAHKTLPALAFVAPSSFERKYRGRENMPAPRRRYGSRFPGVKSVFYDRGEHRSCTRRDVA